MQLVGDASWHQGALYFWESTVDRFEAVEIADDCGCGIWVIWDSVRGDLYGEKSGTRADIEAKVRSLNGQWRPQSNATEPQY